MTYSTSVLMHGFVAHSCWNCLDFQCFTVNLPIVFFPYRIVFNIYITWLLKTFNSHKCSCIWKHSFGRRLALRDMHRELWAFHVVHLTRCLQQALVLIGVFLLTEVSSWVLYRFHHSGNTFSKIETFGQYPLQVNGYRNLNECLEGAMVEGEMDEETATQSVKYVQEVSWKFCCWAFGCFLKNNSLCSTGVSQCSVLTVHGNYNQSLIEYDDVFWLPGVPRRCTAAVRCWVCLCVKVCCPV